MLTVSLGGCRSNVGYLRFVLKNPPPNTFVESSFLKKTSLQPSQTTSKTTWKDMSHNIPQEKAHFLCWWQDLAGRVFTEFLVEEDVPQHERFRSWQIMKTVERVCVLRCL